MNALITFSAAFPAAVFVIFKLGLFGINHFFFFDLFVPL